MAGKPQARTGRRPGPNQTRAAILDAARAAFADAGEARLGDVERVPGVIAFCDVEDPFGNVLSLYAELDQG